LKLSVVIRAPRRQVWQRLKDIPSHVDWMADAVAIRTTGPRTFECETRIGPLRTLDKMEIVGWRRGREIVVRHTGLVTGTGSFALRSLGRRRTRFTWSESLDLPWYFVPPVARLVLRVVWRRNLRTLKRLVEAEVQGLGQ
jgi:carbon monoxide dehydrogenase subunit G